MTTDLDTSSSLESTKKAQADALEYIVPMEYLGERLDRVVAELCPQFSRSQLQKWIKSGDIRLNNAKANVRDKVSGGDEIAVMPVLQAKINDLPGLLFRRAVEFLPN